VREAHSGDWHAILVMAELLKRHDRSILHPVISDTAHVYVACNGDGHVIGMLACHEILNGVMPISNLYTLGSYRRQGVATALLTAAISHASGTELRLTVNRANKEARRIHRRIGFKLSDNVDLKLVVSP
jgi:predicted GNAT family acetyltransferase